jgi:hypothetical protein
MDALPATCTDARRTPGHMEPEMLKVKPREKAFPQELRSDLIAPCGMNCGLCMCYLRDKNSCAGCRAGDEGKAKSCLACSIRRCETPRSNTSGFCFECDAFPCPRLRRLDVGRSTA